MRSDEPEVTLPLQPCHRYVVGVSLLGADWFTAAWPTNWLRIKTPYDPRAPPTHLQHDVIGKRARFTWQHNCQLKDQQPSHYKMRIVDLALNTSEIERIDGLSHEYNGMKKGHSYRFELMTPHEDAIPAVWNISAPPLPVPQNLTAVVADTPQAFRLKWQPVKLHGEK